MSVFLLFLVSALRIIEIDSTAKISSDSDLQPLHSQQNNLNRWLVVFEFVRNGIQVTSIHVSSPVGDDDDSAIEFERIALLSRCCTLALLNRNR